MTVQYSIQKMVSNGTLSTIALGIQYLQRNDIYIRVAGEETPQSGAPSGYTWSFLDNTTLKILPVVPNGVEVVVYRRTDVDAMYNIYSQNAQFDEATIDENNQQLLYIAQEYLEQGLPGAGVDTIEFLRDDGTNTYYRIKRTDGSYSDEFAVPSASSSTKVLTREALRRSYAEAGYNLVSGSFETGGTLVNAKDVLLHESSGMGFTGPAGTVSAGTNPTAVLGYVDQSGELLRGSLESSVLENIDGRFALKGYYFLNSFGDIEVADHREVLQKGLDYIALHGGTLVLPPRDGGYSVKSEHPSHPGRGLVLDASVKPDQYTRGGASILAYDWDSRITLDTASNITSLLYIPSNINYLRMKGVWFDANKKADYAFQASDEYNPFMYLEHCKFYKAKIACARISTFLSQFTGCFFGESDQDGLRLVGIGSGPVTSVTLTGCYAIRNARRGYDFGYLTYCTLNSCAADRNSLAYYFNIASGVVMNGCGAETCDKGIQINAYRGFTINTFYMLTVGSEDPLNPQPYLVEFGSGYGATVQGIRKESGRYHTYLLGSTDSATGSDNITVLDGSVNRDTAYWVPSANFTRPIKFLRGDGTEKSTTVNISTAQQLFDAATRYNSYSVDHDLTLNLAGGDYDLTSLYTLFSSIKGSGTVYIKGSAANPTAVRLITNANMLRFEDIAARLYLKDLVIAGNVPNNGYKRVTFVNCQNVVLDRVTVQKNAINVGIGIENIGSNISMINGSGVDSTAFASGAITVSQGGTVRLEPLGADPTHPGWFVGARYYLKNPVSGGPVGKVWISPAAGWKAFGTIS